MGNFKISVIIPVYRVEKYLNQCVDSVLCQTYKNIEVILVDDGSPDSCPQICDEYLRIDSRVKVIHKQNGGSSSARNAGIDVFTGDYVIFLDSDDYWNCDNFIFELVEKITSKPSDVIIFGYNKCLDDGIVNNSSYNLNILMSVTGKAEHLKTLVKNDIFESQAWSKAIKAEIFKNNDMYFEEGVFSEDVDWSARLILASKSFDVLNNKVYMYRQHKTSITHNISIKNIRDIQKAIIRIVEMSKKIENEDYYEWYMNYCAYQYITFLNCVCVIDKSVNVKDEINEMKSYSYLLNYHSNHKVKIVYRFKKIFGYKGMLKILKVYLKLRG
ncbi:MAG: glycosyltransferase [Ruminococcus sp.]|nr:glycosyltransferase [Ruminococcus sp.]